MFIQVGRLLYTNSGVGLLALTSNGVQRLWKWARNEQNPSGKVLLSMVYQFFCYMLFFRILAWM